MEFIAATAFGTAFLFFLLAYQFIFGEQILMAKRVSEIMGSETLSTYREKELKNPLWQRAVKPLLGRLTEILTKMLPAEKKAVLEKKILMAGMKNKISPTEFLIVKYAAASGIAFCLFLIGSTLGKEITQVFLMGAAGLGLGWMLPDFFLKRSFAKRQEEIERSLPDILDLLTVSVEAGLGFDSAVMKVVEKTKGILANEFRQTLQEIKVGKPRMEALRDMAERIQVNDFSTFAAAIIMADQLGISISNVLRLQSTQMRQKRRQRAEEMAMKTPIKILIPMVLFIFPAIFIVLLGPAAIQISRAFMKS